MKHAECPWPQYYFTLSPASRIYEPYEEPLALPRVCGDPTVPEFQVGPLSPHNPFQTDVYCLGNLVRRDFLQASTAVSRFPTSCMPCADFRIFTTHGTESTVVLTSVLFPCWQVFSNLDFMCDLVSEMVRADPGARPSMDEVVEEFERAVAGLSVKMLRRPLKRRGSWLVNFFLRTHF